MDKMDENYKVYHLKIPGIDKKMFQAPFYQERSCEKIPFNGIITEQKIITPDATDYITLAPKFKPHSDYEMMLQSTDSVVKSPITSLSDDAARYVFQMGYNYIDFLTSQDTINEFGLNNAYPYLVFNYDEYTTDRTSGMSKKPFHLHLNSWKEETMENISQIEKDKVSPYYYRSVVDPMFKYNQALIRETLDTDELREYLEPVNLKCGDQEIEYSSIYRIKKGWDFLQNPEFTKVLKTMHMRLEQKYAEILMAFTGKNTVPPEGTRHILLPEDVIARNIDKTKMRDDVKASLISLSKRMESITPERFQELSKNPDMRDTFITLRWLAYSVGIFSNKYIDPNADYKKNDVYLNITPRLFTKIGGASLMNFPDKSLVKIDRGEGQIDQEEFEKRMEFQRKFAKTYTKER